MLLPIGLMLIVLLIALIAGFTHFVHRYIDRVPPAPNLGPKEHEMTAAPDLSNPPLIKGSSGPQLNGVPATPNNLDHGSAVPE